MEELISMIKPELLIVAVALYLIGFGLKKMKKLKDNYIPLILGLLGIVACFIYLGIVSGFSLNILFSGIVQGVLCASASVYVNQVIKQIKKLNVVDQKVIDVVENIVEKTQDDSGEENKVK